MAENLSLPAMALNGRIRGEGFKWYTALRNRFKCLVGLFLLISFANDLTAFALAGLLGQVLVA